jgi:hypothetical protein
MTRYRHAVAVLLGLFAVAARSGAAQNDAPSGRVARLSYLSGSVSLQVSGDTEWSDAAINYPLSSGDRLYVDRGGRAEIDLGDVTIRLSDATDVTITNLSDNLIQIGVSSGAARLTVTALDNDDSLEIDTPGGPLVVTAPGVYRVSMSPVHGTLVAVDHGSLTVGAGDDATSVEGGHAVALTGDDTLAVSDVDFPPEDDFDRWGGDRDRGVAESAAAQYVDRSTPGYSDLDAAGAWQTDETYGPVWYPSAVPVDWAPYRYGRWIWIEPWGWTWVESEPWGYAPFHYGRWAYVRRRWGWVPGPMVRRPCYAPALVVFVGVNSGPRGGVQAWFPLGPREAYNPWYHVDDRYRRRVNGGDDRTVVDVERAHYVNRSHGFTAVSSETFRGGISVARRTVTVSTTQVTSARVIAHPQVMPTIVAMRGRPAAQPPVINNRVETVVRPMPVRRQPMVLKPEGPGQQPSQPSQPVQPAQPRPEQPPARPVLPSQPLLRARRPAPPPDPAPAVRQQAIESHPGRPLEPQQIDNLRQGKPAGPMKDREVPRDTRPQPQTRPAPRTQAPPPAPAARPQPKKEKPN